MNHYTEPAGVDVRAVQAVLSAQGIAPEGEARLVDIDHLTSWPL